MGTISLQAPGARGEANRRLADRLFRGAVAVTAAITAIWLFFLLTGREGGGAFAGRPSVEAVARVAVGFAIMTVLWGWLWYGVKRISNTAFELFSPRGTDDFTMATANALLCWAFGSLVY